MKHPYENAPDWVFEALEKEEEERTNNYQKRFDGSYEASRGDYEGACLARAEFEAGLIS